MLTKYEEELEDKKLFGNRYEAVIILSPIVSEEDVNKILDTITIKGITIYRKETLGLKPMAYAINGHINGYYVSLSIYATENGVREVEKYIRMHKKILKFIIVRKDD